MDVEAFRSSLPGLYPEFPAAEEPDDPRFAELLEAVPGLTRPNNLALLNHAARHLEPDEIYVEVGSLRGTSLIAAMLENDGKEFVAIDDFSMGGASREELERNLTKFGGESATILEGDAFELLKGGALAGRRVGVYYYDAAHTYEEQLAGLRLIEPHLADEALLVVDDTDWDFVAAATSDYLAAQPAARLLLSIDGKGSDRPQWWEGVQVLAWRR
jgi:predicted O-methyltransferase YrrM